MFHPRREEIRDAINQNGYESHGRLTTPAAVLFTPKASVGVRIYEKVLVDLYGGYESYNVEEQHDALTMRHDTQDGSEADDLFARGFINHVNWGVGARYIINDSFHVVGTYQKDYYIYQMNFQHKPTSATPENLIGTQEKRISDTGFLGLEYRW